MARGVQYIWDKNFVPSIHKFLQWAGAGVCEIEWMRWRAALPFTASWSARVCACVYFVLFPFGHRDLYFVRRFTAGDRLIDE